MKKRFLSIGLTALSILSILMLTLSIVQTRVNVSAASPPPKTFAGYIPSSVTSGQAHLIGHHLGTDHLALAIGLPLRNQQALTQLLNEVSTPRNPHYQHYLTQTQANQAFNPTPQQEQQVIGWLQSHGLTVTHTYPNHLLVDVTGTFAQIEQVFHVKINDFTIQLEGKQTTFYAPSNEPTVDGSVGSIVHSILGLDDYPRFHVDDSLASARPASNGNTHGSPPYYPQDFANAYHVKLSGIGNNGWGQHIGIVLWGPPPSSAALQQFDVQTGAQPPNLQPILVDGGSKYPVDVNEAAEAGMDVEYTSGMAPGATIDYYEAPDTTQGNSTDNGLDDALNMAGTDTNNNAQISDSWGGCEATSISDPFTQATEQILQSSTVTGHDYFFSSGDNGSACVPDGINAPCSYTDPYPQYPASSAYVTSVGGTTFNKVITRGYPGEVAWIYLPSTCINGQGHPPYGSGGGYSKLFARPSWQANFSKNKHRGYPDIAADADLNTGAFVCYDGNNGPLCNPIGGTSLATPLWAGMIADVNELAPVQPLGFITPMLYEMNTGMPYAAYHDIKTGTNGHYNARSGWDAVTGLGSPNLYDLARDAAYLDASVSSLFSVAAVSANDVWAVGSNIGTLIEQWNGSTWNVVSSPNPGYGDLSSVAVVSANDIWAVGSNGNLGTLIEQWNGSSWSVVPSPSPGSEYNELLSVAAVSANDVWAVGDYRDSNGNLGTLIEQWNGSSWSVVPSPSPAPELYGDGLSSVAAVSANDVWAVGEYTDSNYNTYTLIEQWNGSSWSVPSPNPGPGASSVAAVSATDIWAVGNYRDSNGNLDTLTEHWNGSSWTVVPTQSCPGQLGFNYLFGVAVVSATDIWAVGTYLDSKDNKYTLMSSGMAAAGSGNGLSGVAAVSANDVWAVGTYKESGSSNTLIAQWNGSNWTVVSSPSP